MEASLPKTTLDVSEDQECSVAKDNFNEREIMRTSLEQEKDPTYPTAVNTAPVQIHILPVSVIPSMSSDSLVTDTENEKSVKNKGPPPPVLKKPKNPFDSGVVHAMDKPRTYSEFLQNNIKLGRRETALQYVLDDFDEYTSDLDTLSICPDTLGSPSYMCITGGTDTDSQPENPTNYSDLYGKEMDLWTETVDILPEPGGLDISQIRHVLEKKARMKGSPPPVPKKPLNPFVVIERDDILPNSVTADSFRYENCDYKPYTHKAVHEEEPKTIFATDYDNHLVAMDENDFSGFRPVLITQTGKVHNKKTHQSVVEVLELNKTSDANKHFSHTMERRLSPKKSESIH
ncbi:hypothetical protein C0J50_6904 [Silurus asotus]|uniref:Uncharacterized protein n=1 Tax=Silurus asotus TaxID=30991 RepID=A0AAD5A2S3_SILAS|nr:hypothetical protein C0J50_6904 [Silurus asotus]